MHDLSRLKVIIDVPETLAVLVDPTISPDVQNARFKSTVFLTTGTDEGFPAEVLESSTPVLVDFWAPWCGPCRMLHPVLEEIAGERPESLKIVSINIDENVNEAGKLGVVSIPALFIFQDGKLVNKTFGAYPKRHLTEWIDESLSAVAQ